MVKLVSGLSKGENKMNPSRVKYPGAKRNAPCPCGSGKKFKKCCIDLEVSNEKV